MRREEGEKGEREKGSFFGETRFLEVTLLRRLAVGGLRSAYGNNSSRSRFSLLARTNCSQLIAPELSQ